MFQFSYLLSNRIYCFIDILVFSLNFNFGLLVPGVSLRLAFSQTDREDTFFLFNKRNQDLVSLFLDNNCGGDYVYNYNL